MKRIKMANKKLMEIAIETLQKHGKTAFDIAKKAILKEKIEYKPVADALRYFSEEIWCDYQHPALLSLACEAVDGDPRKTWNVGAAIAILSGAVDVHDDIIDKSEIKASKQTVYGKFGEDIALLVGDTLLFDGLSFLHEACGKLPMEQCEQILRLSQAAFFEIGNAEAKESSFKTKNSLKTTEYFEIIIGKAAVAEACMRIGTIIGGGKITEIDMLGHYGRTLATLMIIRDEFIDIFEPDELKHRAENECLPFPILCTFQNLETREKIMHVLNNAVLSEDDAYKIAKIVMKTKDVQKLKKEMQLRIREEIEHISPVRNKKILAKLKLLLRATIEDL
jgi:geranylgeranyl diphosphate synthase type II